MNKWWLLVIMIGLACSAQASEVWVIQPVSPCLSNACIDRQFEIPIGETRIYLSETDESVPLSCVARMREAMRLFDRYIDVLAFPDLKHEPYRSQLLTNTTVWDATMRDCVGTP